ncbi:MAG: hypothetical protein MJ222_05405 [Bacilli bacterium]|nr:hypothetical protein [Bacilli bacterium]
MNNNTEKKNLRLGSFHTTFEGSESGHPGMIYWTDDEHNLYLAITTGSSEYNDDHFEKLTIRTESGVEHSFVNKRPFLGRRKDFARTELSDMHFSINDLDILLRVTARDPREGTRIRSKDRRTAKRAKFDIKKLLFRSK